MEGNLLVDLLFGSFIYDKGQRYKLSTNILLIYKIFTVPVPELYQAWR